MPSKLLKIIKPKIRKDCENVPRPCPFVSCRYNIFLDVNSQSGNIKNVFNEFKDPIYMTFNNCVLDIVEKHGCMTLEDIGKIMNITRERVRQICDASVRKIRDYK